MKRSDISSHAAGYTSRSRVVADASFTAISYVLPMDETLTTITGFRTFSKKTRAARGGHLSRTVETSTIRVPTAFSFKARKGLRHLCQLAVRQEDRPVSRPDDGSNPGPRRQSIYPDPRLLIGPRFHAPARVHRIFRTSCTMEFPYLICPGLVHNETPFNRNLRKTRDPMLGDLVTLITDTVHRFPTPASAVRKFDPSSLRLTTTPSAAVMVCPRRMNTLPNPPAAPRASLWD